LCNIDTIPCRFLRDASEFSVQKAPRKLINNPRLLERQMKLKPRSPPMITPICIVGFTLA
jgi:hypothetical protein